MAISCVFCTTSLLACKHQLLFFGNISWDGGWESKGIINIADDFIRVGDYQWDKSDGQSEWFSGDSCGRLGFVRADFWGLVILQGAQLL